MSFVGSDLDALIEDFEKETQMIAAQISQKNEQTLAEWSRLFDIEVAKITNMSRTRLLTMDRYKRASPEVQEAAMARAVDQTIFQNMSRIILKKYKTNVEAIVAQLRKADAEARLAIDKCDATVRERKIRLFRLIRGRLSFSKLQDEMRKSDAILRVLGQTDFSPFSDEDMFESYCFDKD